MGGVLSSEDPAPQKYIPHPAKHPPTTTWAPIQLGGGEATQQQKHILVPF